MRLGESAQKAVQMGMDDWNAKGGINGRPFELVTGDNANQPQQGVTVSRKLIDVAKPQATSIAVEKLVTV